MSDESLKRVHRIAAGQLGIITIAQLRSCGLSDRRVETLVRSGVLVRVHRGVYRLPGSEPSARQSAYSGAMACGRGAHVSHGTALQAWGLIELPTDRPVDVTVPVGRRPSHDGIVVHRSQKLGTRDVTRLGPIPITRIGRSLIDAAPGVGIEASESALDEALRQRLVSPTRLLQELASCRGMLRQLALDRLDHGIPESELERRAIALLRSFGLPEPVRQHYVSVGRRRYRLDLAYPDVRTSIELEGRAPHWGRDRWESDHQRDHDLELAGWHVLHLTWADVTERGAQTAFTIGTELGLGPCRWKPLSRRGGSKARRPSRGPR